MQFIGVLTKREGHNKIILVEMKPIFKNVLFFQRGREEEEESSINFFNTFPNWVTLYVYTFSSP